MRPVADRAGVQVVAREVDDFFWCNPKEFRDTVQAITSRPLVVGAVNRQNIQFLPGLQVVGVIAQDELVTPQDRFGLQAEFLGDAEQGIPGFDCIFCDLHAGQGRNICAQLC